LTQDNLNNMRVQEHTMMDERYDEHFKKLGERIKTIRLANGYSRPDVARMTGIDPMRIGNYESGTRMNLYTLLLLADALGVKPGALLDGGDVTLTKSVSL